MEEMSIAAYLAGGGRLTSPENVPPRYRAELMKLMATFVDSSLAGAAGFADTINDGPGIKQRIAAAKIVLEKTDNADRVLRIMGEFGADTARYATHHPWTARLDRGADIGATRSGHDMRLAVFNYPIQGWSDAVVMNLLMGQAVVVQLDELVHFSYQPLAEGVSDDRPCRAPATPNWPRRGWRRSSRRMEARPCRNWPITGGPGSRRRSVQSGRRSSTR